jgi:hypothetical protein
MLQVLFVLLFIVGVFVVDIILISVCALFYRFVLVRFNIVKNIVKNLDYYTKWYMFYILGDECFRSDFEKKKDDVI